MSDVDNNAAMFEAVLAKLEALEAQLNEDDKKDDSSSNSDSLSTKSGKIAGRGREFVTKSRLAKAFGSRFNEFLQGWNNPTDDSAQ